jgi:tRNA threonylcarbamoyladenosine biosynthesis protein TsaB
MPTLRQLLDAHAPLLVIDAASSTVQIGWLEGERSNRWATSVEESGVGVFQALVELDVRPADARAFVFCDGPGSILGVRTAAMAIRTWRMLTSRPVFAYHSLALVAHALNRPDTEVIADARRDSWHSVAASGLLRRVPTAELGASLVMPENFRHWTPLPLHAATAHYRIPELFASALDADLFRQTENPDAFLHEEPSYVTWTPHVHRAP